MVTKEQIAERIRTEYQKYKDSSHIDFIEMAAAKLAEVINKHADPDLIIREKAIQALKDIK